MPPVIQKDEKIRCEIIDAAQGLFKRFGLKKTSMEEIADGARKGKSTLYYYFKNKDELFLSVLDRECKDLQQAIIKEIRKHDNIRDRIKGYLNVKIERMTELEVFHEFMAEMLTDQQPQFEVFMYDYESFEHQLMKEMLEDEFARGTLTELAASDLDFTCETICTTLKGLYIQSMLSNNFKEMSGKMVKMVDILLQGILK